MTEETKAEETTDAARGDETPRGEQAPAIEKPLMLGRKLGMLQHFRPDGSAVAATGLAAGPKNGAPGRAEGGGGYPGIPIGYRAVGKKKLHKAPPRHPKECGAPAAHLRGSRPD